jgi:hypothetical protein
MHTSSLHYGVKPSILSDALCNGWLSAFPVYYMAPQKEGDDQGLTLRAPDDIMDNLGMHHALFAPLSVAC